MDPLTLQDFRRCVSVPFKQGESIVKDRLIKLYEGLVLRRTKEILDLPGFEERVRSLVLTRDERLQYDSTTDIVKRCMWSQVGEHKGQSIFGQFQAHLQLRIMCNHGTYQRKFSWKKRSLVEEHEAMVMELGLNGDIKCSGCTQPRPMLGSSDPTAPFIEKCSHNFCDSCREYYNLPMDGGPIHCPRCAQDGSGDVAMTDAGSEAVHTKSSYFEHEGYSTKMEALVEDVKENLDQTKR